MSKAQPELRVALLGQGFMGKAHSNAFAQVSRFFETGVKLRLQVLCGHDTEKLWAHAAAWGWHEVETDWRRVVERKDIDVIDIALPNHLHAPVAIAALEAGKIVCCEKPLANKWEEAVAMARAAKGRRTMVWFNYRRVPGIALARQLIDQGALGEIFHYRGSYQQQWGPDRSRPVNWKMDPAQAGHGVIGDLLSHSIDLALYLNGDIRELTAISHIFFPARQVEDSALALLRFENGSVGSLEATRYGIELLNANRFEIQGEKGMARFNLEELNWLEFFDATEAPERQGIRRIQVNRPGHPFGQNFWKPGHIIGYEHTFIAALGEFLQALANDTEFHPNFDDGLRAQQVMAAVVRSADTKQWEAVHT